MKKFQEKVIHRVNFDNQYITFYRKIVKTIITKKVNHQLLIKYPKSALERINKLKEKGENLFVFQELYLSIIYNQSFYILGEDDEKIQPSQYIEPYKIGWTKLSQFNDHGDLEIFQLVFFSYIFVKKYDVEQEYFLRCFLQTLSVQSSDPDTQKEVRTHILAELGELLLAKGDKEGKKYLEKAVGNIKFSEKAGKNERLFGQEYLLSDTHKYLLVHVIVKMLDKYNNKGLAGIKESNRSKIRDTIHDRLVDSNLYSLESTPIDIHILLGRTYEKEEKSQDMGCTVSFYWLISSMIMIITTLNMHNYDMSVYILMTLLGVCMGIGIPILTKKGFSKTNRIK